jgi:hypothetical protein
VIDSDRSHKMPDGRMWPDLSDFPELSALPFLNILVVGNGCEEPLIVYAPEPSSGWILTDEARRLLILGCTSSLLIMEGGGSADFMDRQFRRMQMRA